MISHTLFEPPTTAFDALGDDHSWDIALARLFFARLVDKDIHWLFHRQFH
jgi:hypothetical protein